MNGYLVLVRRSYSDEPLRLFRGRRAAERFAEDYRPRDGDDAPPGTTTVFAVGVIRFKAGRPGPFRPVVSWACPGPGKGVGS